MARRRDLLQVLSLLAGKVAVPKVAAPPAVTDGARLPLGNVDVVGMRYAGGAARLLALLRDGDGLELRRDLANRYDGWAVAVHAPTGERLGYLPRGANRQFAELLDAGARLSAEVPDGAVSEVAPGEWRLAARVTLHDVAQAPAPDAAQQHGRRALRAEAPLMAERTNRDGDRGARAVMLTGPCAGWQRTREGEWMPPDALSWPAAERIAQFYRLHGGHSARFETARALRDARLPPPEPPPPRRRFVFSGRLNTTAYGTEAPRGDGNPLSRLTLVAGTPGRGGLPRAELRDHDGRHLGYIRHNANLMIANMMSFGFAFAADVSYVMPSEHRTGLDVYYSVYLLGGDPPETARRRAEALSILTRLVPRGYDVFTRFEETPPDRIDRILARVADAAGQSGARLDEATADRLLREW